ncbi:hypothetical protein [uncultured Roseobacter sp.]|jgi:hypothetical protein|uniref:spike base protein, RCAP_Rcc01079 family n=1 Tax=uncultured Roseobacter sp. TaxID=114847 RepID=UPI00260DFDF0|nr:hypothetical protein [uncultured Roseobacter sp.]
MADKFSSFSEGLNSPPACLDAVIPDDNTDLAFASRSLNVATAGNVRVTTTNDDTQTLYIAAGIAFPVRAKRIHATGTDATGIVAMY